MQRIMIVGGSGAGKSTLARRLGLLLDLPVFHLDRMFWRAGWVALPWAEREAALAAALQNRRYVLEGSYPKTYPVRLADCDTLIWLDLGLLRRMVRVWRRMRLERDEPRPDLADGCLEHDPAHARSLWKTYLPRNHILSQADQQLAIGVPGHVRVFRLRSRREVEAFLAGLSPRSHP